MNSKIYGIMLFIFISPLVLYARPKTVVDYYSMTGQLITSKNGKWYIPGLVDQLEVKIVDLKNGYIQIEDPGTGGGTMTKTAALFLKKDQTPVLVEFYTNFYGIPCGIDNKLTVYIMKDNKLTKAHDIIVPLPLDIFLKKNYAMSKISSLGDYANNISIIYKIPRYGTTIEARLNYGCLQWIISDASGHRLTSQQRKGIHELIANIKDKPVLLKWNPKKGKFDIIVQ